MSYNSKYKGSEVEALLDKVQTLENQDLSGYATKDELGGKQDKIDDLAAIRSGAEKGATALQEHQQLKTINGESIVGNGDITIESGAKIYEWFYDGESESITLSQEEYDNIVEADLVVVNLGGLFSVTVSKTSKEVSEIAGRCALIGQLETEGIKLYININIEISTKIATIIIEEQEILTKTSQLENDSNFITSEDVASVALSGSYNDLSDKPTIPSAVTESTVSGWGFTKNTGTYSKPSGGIPKSDLASAVQTSLGKADSALQSYTEKYTGTITGIKMNGASKGTSGVVDLGTVITSHQDISGKQDKLVSGTSIKTINNQSLLGSGNITISGGGEVPTKLSQLENDTNFVALQGEELPYVETAGLYDTISGFLYSLPGGEWTGDEDKKLAGVVNVGGFNLVECQGITDRSGDMIVLPREADGYEDDILITRNYLKTINGQPLYGEGNIEISGGGSSSGSAAYPYVDNTSAVGTTYFTISPNTFYEFGEHTVLEISLGAETSGVANEYLFQFVSGSEATSLTINADIKWTEELVIEPNRIYQVSILKGLASVLSWENINVITFTCNGATYEAESNMTWQQFTVSDYNVRSWSVSSVGIFTGGGYVYYNGSRVKYDDIIIENGSYYISQESGGGGA